jgi:magnesium chelatase family protein
MGEPAEAPALITTRRFAPPLDHVGSGQVGRGQMPLTGDVSLANHGILFLDELPEFKRHTLEVLRQPIEKSITRIQSRAQRRPYGAGHAGEASQGSYESARPI